MRKIGNRTATAQWAMAMGLLTVFGLVATSLAETPATPAAVPAAVPAAAAPAPAATPAPDVTPATAPVVEAPAVEAPAAAPAAPAETAPEIPAGMELVVPAAPVPPPAPPPVQKFQAAIFWPGALIQARVTSEAMPWLDLDTLLRKGRFTADEEEDIPATQRPPADGRQYAILVVKLREKRSVGKYDFNLRTGAETISCLAMSKDDKPYDQRLWEVPFGSGAIEVNLLYEVPAGTTDATLMSALPVTLPQPEIPIHFMVDSPPTAAPVEVTPAAEPAPAATEAAPAATAEAPAAAAPATPAPPATPEPAAGTVK